MAHLGLRLVHQLHDIVEAADLNLMPLKGRKEQVAHHLDVLDLKGNLQHVLAREFLSQEQRPES